MKNKKLIKQIISFIIFGIMVYLFIFFGTKEYIVEESDNIKFSNEYKNVSKNNIYTYVKSHEVLDILNGKSGIIFMGFSSNIWSSYYAEYLNEVAINYNIDNIYYYDFKADRDINSSTYLNIVNKLKDYLYITDTGSADLNAPSILIVNNGDIVYYDDEVSKIRGNITPEEYFTDYKKNLFMTNISNIIEEYFKGE